MEAIAFDLAYFFHVPPDFILNLPLADFEQYRNHANRISQQLSHV